MINTWILASGKGGVGKSTLAAALGVALVEAGKKAVLVDMDLGLRSLDIHLGMENSIVFDVLDYVHGNCKLMEAVLMHLRMPNLGLLPAAQVNATDELTAEQLIKIIGILQKHFDYVLVDAPAGLTRGIETLLDCVDNTLLVVTPDDVSIRDAECVVQLCRGKNKPAPMILLNRVIPELVQTGDQYAPQVVADTLDVPLLGYVPDDLAVLRALHRHETMMQMDCPARYAVERIARRMMGYTVPMEDPVPKRKTKKRWFQRRQRGDGQ